MIWSFLFCFVYYNDIFYFIQSLRLSNNSRQKTTTGEILNLMQVNSHSFLEFSLLGHVLWSAPLQIILVFVLLWFYIGWAMFAGLIVFLLFIPYNVLISAQYNKSETKNIELKDARIKMMNEILNGIKVDHYWLLI